MGSKVEIRPGRVVLADVGGVLESVRVLELWPASSWCPADRVYVEALDRSAQTVIRVDDVEQQECGLHNCLDENDCCKHCGAHFADPCAPGCRHGQEEPEDECDVRPAEDERYQAFVQFRGHDGVQVMVAAVETLQRHGFEIDGRTVQVFRKGDHSLPEWVGVVTLPKRA